MRKLIAGLATAMTLAAPLSKPAHADFTVCNHSKWPIFVSIAYNDGDKGLVSHGWWELQREACERLIVGSVQSKKVWAYAQARSNNGTWWFWWPHDPKVPNIEKLCTTEPWASQFSIHKNEIRGSCKDAGFVERSFRLLSDGSAADRRHDYWDGHPLVPEDERVQKPKDRFWECGGCPEMVVMPTGEFTMGSPDNEPERRSEEGPRHKVTIKQPFAVSKGAITRDQFQKFVEATGHAVGDKCQIRKDGKSAEPGKSFKDPGFPQGGGDPAVCVSFEDAKLYLVWLSKQTGKTYRLLTEAEWEYVARAGTDTPFWWGLAVSPAQANYNGNIVFPNGAKGEFRQKTVSAYDVFKANPWNLFIGQGNAAEWVEDCWNKSYENAPADGSAWSKGDCSAHVVRGGSWSGNPAMLRAAARASVQSSVRSNDVGFRVARTLTQ
jgi:formylglycine-generating enzyme required for sulfatase activity